MRRGCPPRDHRRLAAALRLNAETVLLDGEIVSLDANGRPSFRGVFLHEEPRDGAPSQ